MAADIWSLGCTVLEMLTCQVPYFPLEPVCDLFPVNFSSNFNFFSLTISLLKYIDKPVSHSNVDPLWCGCTIASRPLQILSFAFINLSCVFTYVTFDFFLILKLNFDAGIFLVLRYLQHPNLSLSSTGQGGEGWVCLYIQELHIGFGFEIFYPTYCIQVTKGEAKNLLPGRPNRQ